VPGRVEFDAARHLNESLGAHTGSRGRGKLRSTFSSIGNPAKMRIVYRQCCCCEAVNPCELLLLTNLVDRVRIVLLNFSIRNVYFDQLMVNWETISWLRGGCNYKINAFVLTKL
jgi:hypothetical protein